ncbi:MAG: methyltransferase domain-containing protein [Phycisphaerales bacterium]|nr:methyltransferase domain-containing protein [Phycisphaerales bacterium]
MSAGDRIAYGRANADEPSPEFTGERFVPGIAGDIEVEHVHRYMFARQFVRDRDVLDIASGEGYGCALLADIARSVVGVDIDEQAVTHARDVHAHDNIRFEQGSCTSIPLDDDSVDVVLSYETIEHITEHGAFVAEIRRVLRPGGLLVLSTPDSEAYVEISPEENPYHLRELQRGEFIDLVSSAFEHARFGVQRCLTGSAMVPLDTESAMTTPEMFRLQTDESIIETVGRLADVGLFLVAIASDGPLPPVEWSVLDDPGFGMPETVQLRHEHASMSGSIAEYEQALKSTLEELHAVRRSLLVRVASKLGLVPGRSDGAT